MPASVNVVATSPMPIPLPFATDEASVYIVVVLVPQNWSSVLVWTIAASSFDSGKMATLGQQSRNLCLSAALATNCYQSQDCIDKLKRYTRKPVELSV